MAASHEKEFDPLKIPIRCFIGYFCLIAFFACVILTVQASMESKRMGYESAQLIHKKIQLIDELQRIENRISHLERYKRVSQLLEEHLPHLGPPQHPAIAIGVPGLQERSGLPESMPFPPDDRGIIDQARKQWQAMREEAYKWMTKLVE